MSFADKKFWTIGSGKGGVGKTLLAASFGTTLAQAGKSVVLVDADFSAPDLHSYLGIKPPSQTLLDVLERGVALTDALIPTSEARLQFLACVGDALGMADPTPRLQDQMVECICRLDADLVLIDAGSGMTRTALELFNRAHKSIVVTTPDPAAARCTFRFVRNATYRRIQSRFGDVEEVNAAFRTLKQLSDDAHPQIMSHFLKLLGARDPGVADDVAAMLNAWKPLLLVNMIESDQDLRSAEIVETAARKYLDVDLRTCGLVQYRTVGPRSGRGMSLPDFDAHDDVMAQQIRQLADRLATIGAPGSEAPCPKAEPVAAAAPIMGINDNVELMGRELHVQTEDMGTAGNCIVTQVFCGGRVLLSTRSEYPAEMRVKAHLDKRSELMRSQHFNVINQIMSRSGAHQSPVA